MGEFQHVGLNDDFFFEPGMGIELGIQGAGFLDDLLFGNAMINIPAASLQQMALKADTDSTFDVVVNASAISNPSTVNLTVKHFVNSEVVWERNQLVIASPGQILSCEVSTNDTMTDLEPEEATTTQQTGFIGSKFTLLNLIFTFSPVLMVLIILKRKKKD
jgi:hypothetical protein